MLKVFVVVQSLSHVPLFCDIMDIAHQTSLSMGFSRQEYWYELPFPSPGIFLEQGSNPQLLHLQADLFFFFFFTTEPPGNPTLQKIHSNKMKIKQMTNI